MMETGTIWMCEVCEQAPVAFTCKADATALCAACDADIHSANHLARRHDRVPVDPFLNASSFQQEDALGSWLLPKLAVETDQIKTGGLVFSEMDPFLDLEYSNPFHLQHQAFDGVVPVPIRPVAGDGIESSFHVDFSSHKLPTFSCRSSQSISHSGSSSLEAGVVSDGNFLSTMIDPSIAVSEESGHDRAAQSGGMNREARVLRYREKRKNRKYEKTVRYASRKAYAETRPRIKGRFVKRNQVEHHMAAAIGLQYGVVPYFEGR